MIDIKEINKELNEAPPELLLEIRDYINFLLSEHEKSEKAKTPFDFSWEGGLSELAEEYTSVALQHEASEWR